MSRLEAFARDVAAAFPHIAAFVKFRCSAMRALHSMHAGLVSVVLALTYFGRVAPGAHIVKAEKQANDVKRFTHE